MEEPPGTDPSALLIKGLLQFGPGLFVITRLVRQETDHIRGLGR
jgi:hypothetical protein